MRWYARTWAVPTICLAGTTLAGNYYDTYAAHRIFDALPDLGIKSVLTLEWWYCPVRRVAYEGLCGHREHKQDLSGTLIRSIIQGGVEPAPQTLRAEVLQVVRECATTYGFVLPLSPHNTCASARR